MNHDQTASQLPAEHVHIDIKRDECVPVKKINWALCIPWLIAAFVLLTAAHQGGWFK